MSVEFCNKCGKLYFPGGRHVCPSRWRVWREDESLGEARLIYANNGKEAAEKWAEEEDSFSCDYYIVGGDEVVVNVIPEDVFVKVEEHLPTDRVETYRVSGESVPRYYATALKGRPG